jgi:uncharacterized protein YjbI with pentapeptide repeats
MGIRGPDLQGLVHKNGNISGAFLPGANLRGAQLHRARLKRAILLRATLCDAVLSRADLNWAILKRADARDVDLSDSSLVGANLRCANLERADLRNATAFSADLRDVVLRGANLAQADLRDANLRGSDLTGAILQGGNFLNADLHDADLTGVVAEGANFKGADLTGAVGAESIRHRSQLARKLEEQVAKQRLSAEQQRHLEEQRSPFSRSEIVALFCFSTEAVAARVRDAVRKHSSMPYELRESTNDVALEHFLVCRNSDRDNVVQIKNSLETGYSELEFPLYSVVLAESVLRDSRS